MMRQPWKTIEGCQPILPPRTGGDALAIPANWMILRARRPSAAIKISKILFGGTYEGLVRAARRMENLLSKREEGEVAWYGLG